MLIELLGRLKFLAETNAILSESLALNLLRELVALVGVQHLGERRGLHNGEHDAGRD